MTKNGDGTYSITYTVTIHFSPTTHKVYETMPGYTVSLADGTEDAGNWSIEPKEGLSEGDQVTIQYNGRLKVKSVKAVSDGQIKEILRRQMQHYSENK